MKKITLIIMLFGLALFDIQVLADEVREAEIPSQLLRLSNDGTGVIKVPNCDKNGCKNILVKVTQSTKGVLDGLEMGLLQAKNLSRPGFVSLMYFANSKEALAVGFTRK